MCFSKPIRTSSEQRTYSKVGFFKSFIARAKIMCNIAERLCLLMDCSQLLDPMIADLLHTLVCDMMLKQSANREDIS